MAKKEVKTDLWVAKQLDECEIRYDAQGSSVREIDEALKSASKRGTGNAGFPEYVAVIGDFVLVIEDKADTARHIRLTESASHGRQHSLPRTTCWMQPSTTTGQSGPSSRPATTAQKTKFSRRTTHPQPPSEPMHNSDTATSPLV